MKKNKAPKKGHADTRHLEAVRERNNSDSAGQSGDAQGLSQRTSAAEESVRELAETDQSYEADIEVGVEEAADHPERPVPAIKSTGL
jgi:hypothetical protein